MKDAEVLLITHGWRDLKTEEIIAVFDEDKSGVACFQVNANTHV